MRIIGKGAALALPSVRKYLTPVAVTAFTAVVAVDGRGQRLGAAWYRVFPSDAGSYGFVARTSLSYLLASPPMLAAMGWGRPCSKPLAAARAGGYDRVSLSVDRQNPARTLYERLGFHDAQVSPPTTAPSHSVTLRTLRRQTCQSKIGRIGSPQ